MATIKSEMPPLPAVETPATSLSSLGSGGISTGVGGGTSGSPTNSGNATANSVITSSASGGSAAVAMNNTISAAADSSDNQPATPQPQTQQIGVNEQHQSQPASSTAMPHHLYAAHNMYTTASTAPTGGLPHMYPGGIYATSGPGNNGTGGHDMQQQQQQQQQLPSPTAIGSTSRGDPPVQPDWRSRMALSALGTQTNQPLQQQQQQQQLPYNSYMSSYEHFYQQQGQTQSSGNQGAGGGVLDYGNAAALYGSNNSGDYKTNPVPAGVRYHPYSQTPISNGASNNGNNDGHDTNPGSVLLSANNSNSAAVSTTTAMSPRVGSSSSPTSTSSQLHMGSGNGGNPQSPVCNQQFLCKKCSAMCTNETELQEHITNVHGASPYGSSGYSSSPYIKEELTPAPPTQPQQQQTGGNPGELLDLDSQKLVYPPMPGSMQSIIGGHSGLHHQHNALHDPIVTDPLHSMHTMQQRALSSWDPTAAVSGPEVIPNYMPQIDISAVKPNQSPYYSPKQSPYGGSGTPNIKHEFPIKSEYPDSQNYVDKSFPNPNVVPAPDMCQQQQQSGNTQQSISSSPAEFPSTTTGSTQDQQQQYRSFEPPTSSSALPANSMAGKSSSWKSNEARRPKTYHCTACNKWFTSSGHLKRHYNTTLHKNAVKTSGQPDPANLPISTHHHPARDPSGRQSRRGGSNNSAAAAAAAAAKQQKPPAPVQPPEPPRTPPEYGIQAGMGSGSGGSGLGRMSHYSNSPSPTSGSMSFNQQNGYQSQQSQSYLSQVQSSSTVSPQHVSNAPSAPQSQTQSQNQSGTVLNGHPNGLAGPSVYTTLTTVASPTLLMPSSHTRGLLNTTTTPIIKHEVSAEEDTLNSNIINSISSQMGMAMTEMKAADPPSSEGATATVILELQPYHPMLVKEELSDLEPYPAAFPQPNQQPHYHNSTSHNQAQSPLIISHQQYQDQLHLQQPMVADNIFSQQQPEVHMLQQQPQVHMLQQPLQPLPANTMEAYSTIPSDTNMLQQHNSNTQLLPLSQPITSTHMATTVSMLDSTHMLPQHNILRHLQQLSERGLAGLAHSMLNTTPTTSNMEVTTPHTSTTITPQQQHMYMQLPQLLPSITNPTIPSFQTLVPLEPHRQPELITSYHHIVGSDQNGRGNSSNGEDYESPNTSDDLLQLRSYGSYSSDSMFSPTDGQLLQLMPNSSNSLSVLQSPNINIYHERTNSSLCSSTAHHSPQEDWPAIKTLTYTYSSSPPESPTTLNTEASEAMNAPVILPSNATGNNGVLEDYSNVQNRENMMNDVDNDKSKSGAKPAVKRGRRGAPIKNRNPPKRKRMSPGEIIQPNKVPHNLLPSGRIQCVLCGKTFAKVCYLTQHNKCFHSGEYPYRCIRCGKRYQIEAIYKIHLARHEAQDKPFKCTDCPKQFHHKTDLRRHIEGIHSGFKQHVCSICSKDFCRRDHLNKHIETHNRPRAMGRRSAKKTANKPADAQRTKSTEVIPEAIPEVVTEAITEAIREAENTSLPALAVYNNNEQGMDTSPPLSDSSDFNGELTHVSMTYLMVAKENNETPPTPPTDFDIPTFNELPECVIADEECLVNYDVDAEEKTPTKRFPG